LSLSPSRERLRGPEIFLATQDEQDELLDNIAEKLKELRKQVDEIASDGLMSSVANGMSHTIDSFIITALMRI
jgi:hypothetical protein